MTTRSHFRGRLAERLSHLAGILEDLGHRLREAISTAVGQEVAGAVCKGVNAALSHFTDHRPQPYRPPWQSNRSSSMWEEREEYRRWGEYEEEEEEYDGQEPLPEPTPRSSPRYATALKAGLQAASIC